MKKKLRKKITGLISSRVGQSHLPAGSWHLSNPKTLQHANPCIFPVFPQAYGF